MGHGRCFQAVPSLKSFRPTVGHSGPSALTSQCDRIGQNSQQAQEVVMLLARGLDEAVGAEDESG